MIKYILGLVLLACPLWGQTADDFFRMAESETDTLRRFVLLTDAIESNEDSHWPFLHMAYLQRGQLYHQMGFDEEALSDLSRSLVHFNGQSQAHYLRADIFTTQKRWDHVSRELMVAEQKDLHAFSRYLQRGESYFYNGQYKEAIKDFDAAIARGIVTVPLAMMKVLAQLNIYEFEQGLQDLQALRTKLDQDAVYYFLKGMIYYLLMRERNWVLHQGQSRLIDVSQDPVWSLAKQQAEESLGRAHRLGFVLHHQQLWTHLGRVREFLTDFLRFFDAQR